MIDLSLDRRRLMQGAALGLGALALPISARSQSKARIVIIGGGFGGASAAALLRRLMPSAQVTLVDANPTYTACPFSNLVIGTDRPLSAQQYSNDS